MIYAKEVIEDEIAYRVAKRANKTLATAIMKVGKELDYNIEKLACLLFDAAGTAAQWLDEDVDDHTKEIELYKRWRQILSEHIYSARFFQQHPDSVCSMSAAVESGERAEHILEKEGL